MIAFAPPPEPECCQAVARPCDCCPLDWPDPTRFTVTISDAPVCDCEAGALLDALLTEMRGRGGTI